MHTLKSNIVSIHIPEAMFTYNNIVFYTHRRISIKIRVHVQIQNDNTRTYNDTIHIIVDTAKLICVFVFAYAKSRFSHNEAYIVFDALSNLSCFFPRPLVPVRLTVLGANTRQ